MLWKNREEGEILSDLDRIRSNRTLWLEKNFVARSETIDHLEFHVIERIRAIPEYSNSPERQIELINDAVNVRDELEEINAHLFRRLRSKISGEGYRGRRLLDLIEEQLDRSISSFHPSDSVGYDHLDLLLNGILTFQDLPVETKEREPDMVFYQKTPARIVFELIEKAAFKPGDLFVDLGSGLGQVVMLVNLFASVPSTGVEYEPAFCEYAKKTAADLQLDGVDFINKDARDADYSTGTVFFMYTPFEGKMLREVIRKLQGEAKKRKIRIFSYGPCTGHMAGENWLIPEPGCTAEFGAFRTAG